MESIFSKKNIPMVVMNISTIVIVSIMIVVRGAAAKPSEVQTNQSFSSGVLSYQGTLTDPQGNPLTGLYEMVFRVYPSISGGAVLWTESRMGENAVLVPCQN